VSELRPLFPLAARHLDAGGRLGEVLFGLIMTLTFTLGAGMVIDEEGRAGARELLIATIGCNLAWGLIDGVLYVLGQVFERGRLRKVGQAAAQSLTDAEALELVAAEYEPLLAPVAGEPERRSLYASMIRRLRSTPFPRNGIRKEDLYGGLASGWLVFVWSVPAALPFLFMDDPRLALRVSNGVLLALLFVVGYRTGRATLVRPWLAGLTLLLLGLVLVVVAIALGG
jgi:hypothetical protein